MLAGPIFTREALTSPRQLRHYLIRSGYVAALFVLMYTASQATFGWQQVRNIGDIARFGSLVFQMFSLVQLLLVLFFALLFAAGNVAQEKDRKTLILLLMTDLSDRELVLGKLCSSLLIVGVLLMASLPVFCMAHLLGGVTLNQIAWSWGICATTAVAAGSWGTFVAYWRDKTFQTLAISVLGVVIFIGLLELVSALGATSNTAQYVALLNPFRALLNVLAPLSDKGLGPSLQQAALTNVAGMLALAVLINFATVFRLRIWNPPRAIYQAATETEKGDADQAETAVRRAKTRNVWHNPVVWREICTRAYGRKIFVIKFVYLAIAFFLWWAVVRNADQGSQVLGMVSPAGFVFLGLSLLSLVLINAQAVTALTSERDAKTLELLMVTEITAKEFIFGKIGGVYYNTKELLLVPLLIAGYLLGIGVLNGEQFAYLFIGFLALTIFVSMLGLHSSLSFENSRSAIANSLGTIFFLFIGVFIFMMLLVEARSSFFLQFQSFVLFIGVGSIALYASLTHKNPSVALTIAAGALPFLTFYSITEFLLEGTLGVCFAICVGYGFATVAMLIPAISEFDVALGRTTMDQN